MFRFSVLSCILLVALAGRTYALDYAVNIHVNDTIPGGHPGRVTIVISGDVSNAGTTTLDSYDPGGRTAGDIYFAGEFPGPRTMRSGEVCPPYCCPPSCCAAMLHGYWYISGAAYDGTWTIAGAADTIGGHGHE